MRFLSSIALLAIFYMVAPFSFAEAIYDPLSVPNNKFGIHLINATTDESSPAASLVNTNGDWGYITILIESKDRDRNKWQEFFNDLRRKHLIPIIRLATKPMSGSSSDAWEIPYEGEEKAWGDFLDSLNWPVKNRYIVVYNEPNQGKEWGNIVDARMYAKVLDKVITELKSRNRDYFILNAGFDASSPSKPPNFEDEVKFLQLMNNEVPGIFNRLDGWATHSYPDKNFTGKPDDTGRGSISTWFWELQILRSLGVTKNLPVFITETGWQHSEGIKNNPNFPSADTVAKYYEQSFEKAWSVQRIVAITPFLLDYQESPFDHFSFKKFNGNGTTNSFYPQFQVIKGMRKVFGSPIQENKAQLVKGEIYSSIVAGESYNITLTFRNIGQSIWNDGEIVKVVPLQGGGNLGIKEVAIPKETKVEPNAEYTFILNLTAPESGSFDINVNLFSGGRQFDSLPVNFKTEVKNPVFLKIKSLLKWKNSSIGEYFLTIKGINGDTTKVINLLDEGISEPVEARYLLPDYTFDFILEKPFYKPKSIKQKVDSGINILDFGKLEPDLITAFPNIKRIWELLPFSN